MLQLIGKLRPVPGRAKKALFEFQDHPDIIITENKDQQENQALEEEIPDPE
jgi:hypothetical protein